MTIQSAGNLIGYPQSALASAPKGGSPAASNSKTVEQSFLDYLKEPPAQRMIDAWLKAHGLTEEDLKKMPPKQREAIEKQMAQDIKNQAKQKAEAKSGISLTSLL